MFFGSLTAATTRLLRLARLRVLDRFQPHSPAWGCRPYHYVLGPIGAAVEAADRGDDPDRAARRWKGERTLALGRTQRLAHIVGVNGVYASLVGHARHCPDAALIEWMTEAEAARWTEGIVRPDAFGRWQEGGEAAEFFLEYDRGTESCRRLVESWPTTSGSSPSAARRRSCSSPSRPNAGSERPEPHCQARPCPSPRRP